jgi:predicted transposase/invertase (TIGR01784 family)
MSQLPTPHNNLFHFAMTHLGCARSLIESQFSRELVRELDLDTLQLEKESFIDSNLRQKYSDVLLSVRYARPTKGDSLKDEMDVPLEAKAYVYILLEHKSERDEFTALQLLGYIVRFYERMQRDEGRLSPILPLVVYHDASAWTAADSFRGLLDAPPVLLDYQLQFRFAVLDLCRVSDRRLLGEPILQSVMRLLKYGRDHRLRVKLRGILELLRSASRDVNVDRWVEAFGVYVMAVNKSLEKDELNAMIQSVFPTQIEPGSLAARLIEQGLEQGLERGNLEGRIQTLQGVLGDPVATVDELRGADLHDLELLCLVLQERIRDRGI